MKMTLICFFLQFQLIVLFPLNVKLVGAVLLFALYKIWIEHWIFCALDEIQFNFSTIKNALLHFFIARNYKKLGKVTELYKIFASVLTFFTNVYPICLTF